MITQLELGITDGVSVSLVSINVRRLVEDTLNTARNFKYRNHQVHSHCFITLYFRIYATDTINSSISGYSMNQSPGQNLWHNNKACSWNKARPIVSPTHNTCLHINTESNVQMVTVVVIPCKQNNITLIIWQEVKNLNIERRNHSIT
jgi:hypothetical protein